MHFSVLLSFLALVDGLKDGLPSADIKGSCAWSPLLILNEDVSCRSDPASTNPGVATDRLTRHKSDATASSNETGWEGPKHCVREYCVYSNRKFAGGITVITTAENARRIAEIPEITAARSGLPPFYATEVPGKGTGLVANRTIRRGEVIMTWQPSFVIHRRLPDDLSGEEQHRILDAALLKLPAPRRRAFLRQLGQFGGHRVSDILLTNSFQMDVGAEGGGGEEGHHLSNFPDVSLYNHDCRPNTAFYIDDQLTHHTHAVRNIEPGEELTLTYMNPFETFAARQAHIRSSWGFQCTCRHCSMSEAEIRASDARLYEIDEMEAELGDFASTRASVVMVERLLEVYELERLDVKVHGAYVLAALNFNLFGDAKRAGKYARQAVETGIVEFGPDADDVAAMRELARDPKAHFTWRKRV